MVEISSGLYSDSLISKQLSEEIRKKMKKMDDSVMYAFYLTHILLYAGKQYQLEKVGSGSNNSGKFSSTQRQVKQMKGASGLKELETSYVENVSAIKINLKQRLENIAKSSVGSTSSASVASEIGKILENAGITLTANVGVSESGFESSENFEESLVLLRRNSIVKTHQMEEERKMRDSESRSIAEEKLLKQKEELEESLKELKSEIKKLSSQR